MAKGGVSISVKGLPKVTRFLNKKERNVKGSIKRAMNLVGIHVQGEVKTSITGQRAEHPSFITGDFMRSVDFKTAPGKVTIFSKISYAQKLEFSTTIHNSPRRHFRNTLAREKGRARQIIQKEVNKI